jgi:CMP-N-acetylneuraminic acid synthetase
VPGKNLRLVGGRPLIAWSIEHAMSVARVRRVIVSTDSTDIALAAREAGAEVPFMRPIELATDTAPEWFAWRHAISYLRESEGAYPDAMLVVPATAPLRDTLDLERCLDEFERGDTDVVITVTEANRSPYFNMVVTQPDGYSRLVIPPSKGISRRQDVPVVYDMTTVGYVVRPSFVVEADGLFAGRVRSVHVPAERALDIDTVFDLQVAEYVMADRHRKAN